MHNMGKTIGELHALLIEYEIGLPKKAATPQVMAIQGGRIQKANKKLLNTKGNGKGKGIGKDKSYIPKPKNPKTSAKEHPAKDDTCHHCKEVGHWKRSCPSYLAELIKKKKRVGTANSSDIFTIELFSFPNKSWVYDTGRVWRWVKVCKVQRKLDETSGSYLRLTPPYTPQHNKVSERRNRTLLDMVRSMMNLTTLPLSFWDYALETATRILNMVPTKKALVKRDTPIKLQQRSVKCIFIGYPKETMEISKRAEELEEIQDEDTSPFENTSEIPIEVEGFKPPQEEVIPILARCYECGKSMKDNQVWHLVNLPPNCKAAGSKWLFKKKTNIDGIVHTYIARLVAKGFTQTYGVDYKETFSPIADIRAIRILIAIAAFYDYEIWQMDVKTVFLNGYLNEDIYMVRPEGFIDPKHPKKVCKLQRSICGLKQESRSWNKRFDEEIKRFGFAQNLDESCVYQKASRSNVTFLILYVDDIIIMGNHIPSLQSVKSYLGKCFAIKDLGEPAFIHGIKIYRDESKRLIGLSQSSYMDKILKKFKMDNSKRGNIPMQERLDLNKTQGASTPGEVKHIKNVPYVSHPAKAKTRRVTRWASS
ncbi:retrotransposon protein, putative, ty1-copia subclass [Tanacetum coccineum]